MIPFIQRRWFPLIVFGALIVRLPQLPLPLWYDESFTQWLAGLAWDRMLSAIGGDVHPPLFFILEWLIGRISTAPVAMRLVSLVCSLAAFWVLRAIMDDYEIRPGAQAVACLLLAFSSFQIYYAGEARMYALLQLLYLLAVWCAGERHYLRLSLVMAAMLYTQNYGLLYCAAAGAYALYVAWLHDQNATKIFNSIPQLSWPRWQYYEYQLRTMGAGGYALMCYLPWGVQQFTGQAATVGAGYWITKPAFADVLATFKTFYVASLGGPVGVVGVGACLALTLFSVGKVLRQITLKDYSAPTPLLFLAYTPIVLAVAISALVSPIYLTRALIGASPFWYVLAAWALTHQVGQARRVLAAAALVPLFALGLFTGDLRTDNILMRFDTPTCATLIRARQQTGDVIFHLGLASYMQMRQQELGLPEYMLTTLNGVSGGGYSQQTRIAMGIYDGRTLDSVLNDRPTRIWLIYPWIMDADQGRQREALLRLIGDYRYEHLFSRRTQQGYGLDMYLIYVH